MSSTRRFAGALLMAAAWPTLAHAEVLFENPGNTDGWGRVFTQKAGTITVVTSPVYRGATAVKTTQTYQSSDGRNYHSEIIKTRAHLAGQDLYYGHAVYLPPDWVFHGQNVTFQQWAPEDPEGPWILMYLQGEKIRLGGRGANGDKGAGSVSGLKGTWIRFVTRIHMAEDGAFEVWINGQKTFSQRGNFRSRGPSMRWSNGIYCTRWDTETPTGPRELTFWHDNMRIATTYAEADPASWGDGPGTPQADAGAAGPDGSAPSRPDGGGGAADTAPPSGAGDASSADPGQGPPSGSGGAGMPPVSPPPPLPGSRPDAAAANPGRDGGRPSPTTAPASSGGCSVGGASPDRVGVRGGGWLALLVAVFWFRRLWKSNQGAS